ncbi:MAG: hypothetical protein MK108_01145 [Mariniblastus sp.]|nr:hypothetical protein [Mariniblastus sp.]
MIRGRSILFSHVCWMTCAVLVPFSNTVQADQFLRFDVPATCAAVEQEPRHQGQKTVEIIVPVSLDLATDSKISIRELQVEIQWNRGAYQVTDYQPRTTMQSEIVGTIQVEDRQDRHASAGLDISSGYFDAVSGKACLQAGQKNGQTLRYEEMPEHDILVTSGTIKRGTGVNFCFKPSRSSTLLGSRDLKIICQVPEDWKGGVLLVKCRARANRKFLGTFDDALQQGSAFVLPVFLQGNRQARNFANEFVRTEQQLRSEWRRYQTRQQGSQVAHHWNSMVGRTTKPIPNVWVHQLIQAGDDDWLEKYRQQLPSHIHSTAHAFVEARRELVELGR